MYVYTLATNYTIKDDLALPILLALTLKGGLQAKHTMLILLLNTVLAIKFRILHVMQALYQLRHILSLLESVFFSITNYKVNLSTRSKPSI